MIFLTGLLLILLAVIASPAWMHGVAKVNGESSALAIRAREVFAAMTLNASEHEAGAPWVDPSAFPNSTEYIQALCAESPGLAHTLGRYTNIWCVVVNAPNDDAFPVIFTANLTPGDLIRKKGERRRVSLTCPKELGGECIKVCEKVAIVVRKGGAGMILRQRFIHTVGIPEDRLSELADTYVLTPTGRVALAGKVAAEQDADDAELPPDDVEPKPGMVARDGAVGKVLWWLKATQQEDGSWNDGPCPVGATALGICAFLAHGEFPGCYSPYAKDFSGTVIAASEYVMGCVSETNGVLRIRGGEDDERALPIVTKALCEIYGMTQNPNVRPSAVRCLRHLVSRARSGLASGAWQGKDELLLWAAEALWAGRLSMMETLSKEEMDCLDDLCARVFELTSGLGDSGYCGGMRRYWAWMRAGATKKDAEEYRDWMKGKKTAFVKALKEDQEKIADTKGVLHGRGFLSESIDAKPSGLGVSADSALGVMELMIGGGGGRNLPPPIMPPGFRPPDHSSVTNGDAGVSVDI